MKNTIFLFAFCVCVSISLSAQKNPLTGYSFWNVNVHATRSITTTTTIQSSTDCEKVEGSGKTTFTLNTNMSCPKFPAKFSSGGNFQLYSDNALAKDAQITAKGNATLEVNELTTTEMNTCNDAKCTKTDKKTMQANVALEPSKSNFSFDFTGSDKTGFANLTFGFEEDKIGATGNTSISGCGENGGGDMSELAKLSMSMMTQTYGQFSVGNLNQDYLITMAEQTGIGYTATITALPEQKGFIVVFNYSKMDTREEGNKKIVTQYAGTLQMNIGQEEDLPYEAIIECVEGEDTYKKFIPEGRPIPLNSKMEGNSLKFRTKLIDKRTQEVITNVDYQTEYTLQSVSHEAGICNNAPMKISADKEPDYKFSDMLGSNYAEKTDTRVLTQKKKGDVPVMLTSYDYGGTVELHAEVMLESGKRVTAKRADKKLDYIPIPYDENANAIADEWETQKGIKSNNYLPKWDEENDISLKKAGDGISLYEEYRGFAVRNPQNGNKMYKRFSPKNLEVCFYLDGSHQDWARASFKKMQELTGIQFIEIESNNDLEVIKGSQYPRQINFNSESYALDKQCAIFAKLCEEERINTIALKGIPDEKSICPNEVDVLHIGLKDGEETYKYLQRGLPPANALDKVDFAWTNAAKLLNEVLHENIDLSKVNEFAEANKTELARQYVCFAILHELGHAIGCQHHELEAYLRDDAAYKGLSDFKNMWQTIERIKSSHLPKKQEEAEIRDTYKLYGYKEVDGFDYFEKGEIACPMRYWFTNHTHLEILSFLAGNWKPFDETPIVKKKWALCAENWQEIHLK